MFYDTNGAGRKPFHWIGRKKRRDSCIFFEAASVKVLRKLKTRKGPAENTSPGLIKIGKKTDFLAGFYYLVAFSGIPEGVVKINGQDFLKIKVISGDESIFCYSEITGGKCFCLEVA
ncbi:MAG: hypothetical protein WC461_03340 [Candidatus Paceibacterota bacterium]